MKFERVVLFSAATLLCVGGASVVSLNTKSDTAIQHEYEVYQPTCNDRVMIPGDICLRLGGRTESYDEMVDGHRPDQLRAAYTRRRNIGFWLIGAGGTLAALGVLVIMLAGWTREAVAAPPTHTPPGAS